MGLTVYIDLESVPSDTPPPDVGDWHPSMADQPPRALAAAVPNATQDSLVVPFTRPIKAGTAGTDVKGAKRALWRANGLKPGGFTETFGTIAVKQLKVFQHTHGLPADGVLGPATLHALAPSFDRYAFLLYEGYPPGLSPVQAKRQRALSYLLWAYNNRASIYYAQLRPMPYMNDLEHLPVSEDCSTVYTKSAKYGGWSDPNGRGYDGAGYTGTLLDHGRRVTEAKLQPGDGVFYSSPAHVGGYVGGGRIISHGSDSGPALTPIGYRPDVQEFRSYL